jgi:hypothetical protein
MHDPATTRSSCINNAQHLCKYGDACGHDVPQLIRLRHVVVCTCGDVEMLVVDGTNRGLNGVLTSGQAMPHMGVIPVTYPN